MKVKLTKLFIYRTRRGYRAWDMGSERKWKRMEGNKDRCRLGEMWTRKKETRKDVY